MSDCWFEAFAPQSGENGKKPRITISAARDGLIEIWLNPEGRDLLVRELLALNGDHEHFHMMNPNWIPHVEVPLSDKPYRTTDKVFEVGKVYLRLDDWDRKYFPQVMGEDD